MVVLLLADTTHGPGVCLQSMFFSPRRASGMLGSRRRTGGGALERITSDDVCIVYIKRCIYFVTGKEKPPEGGMQSAALGVLAS